MSPAWSFLKKKVLLPTLLQVLHLGMKDNTLGFFLEVSFQALLGFLQLISDIPAALVKIL